MKCHEVQALQGPYLDSELDTRTSLEIAQHLKSCPECARLFGEEQQFEAWLGVSLKQGSRSDRLWERTERAVLAAAGAPAPPQPVSLSRATFAEGWPLSHTLRKALQFFTGSARGAWAGMAVAWIFIVVLNSASRESSSLPVARQPAPSPSEIRFAVKQKRLLMAELTVAADSAAKSKTAAPGPHTQKRIHTLRT